MVLLVCTKMGLAADFARKDPHEKGAKENLAHGRPPQMEQSMCEPSLSPVITAAGMPENNDTFPCRKTSLRIATKKPSEGSFLVSESLRWGTGTPITRGCASSVCKRRPKRRPTGRWVRGRTRGFYPTATVSFSRARLVDFFLPTSAEGAPLAAQVACRGRPFEHGLI